MTFRFRYLRPGGQEAHAETLERLTELLERGEIAPDTLLYDAMTGEWAPLRAHAVGRLLMEVEGGASPPGAPDAAAGDEAGVGGLDLPPMSLTLTDADVSGPTAEDAIRELLRERQDDLESGRDGLGFTAAPAGADGLVVDAGLAPPEPAPRESAPAADARHEAEAADEREAREDAPRRRPRSAPHAPAARSAVPPPALQRPPVQVPVMAPERPRSRRAPARALVAVGSAGLLGLLLYAVAWSDDRPDAPYVPVASAAASPAPSAPTSAATLLGTSETVALADMVEALEGLRVARDLDRVPRDWLEGVYLANASRYPEVREYWGRYAAFVDEVRQRDTALFRQSFVRRLDAQGVTGALVAMRLSRAVRAFEESAPARDTVYAAMAGLAAASIELHDLLVAREDDIEYDPVRSDRVSRDPVVEAVTDDPELRDRMWGLLDRIFLSLDAMSGGRVGARDALTERSLDGIRATGGL